MQLAVTSKAKYYKNSRFEDIFPDLIFTKVAINEIASLEILVFRKPVGFPFQSLLGIVNFRRYRSLIKHPRYNDMVNLSKAQLNLFCY